VKYNSTTYVPNDVMETGLEDVLGLPLSGVEDPLPGDWLVAVGGRSGDCGFSAEPGW